MIRIRIRIRNVWAVLTGKATVCTHDPVHTWTLNYSTPGMVFSAPGNGPLTWSGWAPPA